MDFDNLHPKRQEIIIQFHAIRAKHPHMKRINIIREAAKKTNHRLAPSNQNNSFVMKVIRQWEPR